MVERLPNELKKGGGMCAALCAGHHFPKIQIVETASKRTHHENNFSHAPPTCGRGRPTTNDQSRGVMRNPVRDPMRGVDLMVLGYVGASTASHVAPGNRGFSSQAAPGNQLPD